MYSEQEEILQYAAQHVATEYDVLNHSKFTFDLYMSGLCYGIYISNKDYFDNRGLGLTEIHNDINSRIKSILN